MHPAGVPGGIGLDVFDNAGNRHEQDGDGQDQFDTPVFGLGGDKIAQGKDDRDAEQECDQIVQGVDAHPLLQSGADQSDAAHEERNEYNHFPLQSPGGGSDGMEHKHMHQQEPGNGLLGIDDHACDAGRAPAKGQKQEHKIEVQAQAGLAGGQKEQGQEQGAKQNDPHLPGQGRVAQEPGEQQPCRDDSDGQKMSSEQSDPIG